MKSIESAETKKAEEKTAIAAQSAMPSYLQKYKPDDNKPTGLQDLQKYWVPPRLKIVQSQSGEQYKKNFQVGDVLLVPQMSLVAHSGESFWITPIFQYTEFCLWNPYGMKGQLSAIRERSTDPSSQIARRARSKKEADWYEICPESPKTKQNDPQYMLRNCEHINYICVLRFNGEKPKHPANELVNNPFVISFHHASFWEGKQLSTLILNRQQAIFACQYELTSADKSNAKGNWKGLNINNPSMDSGMTGFVDSEEDFLAYRTMYETIQRQFVEGEIRTEYEDEEESEPVADSAGKF